jgi:XRE family transcriptional regulator of biofilm formation
MANAATTRLPTIGAVIRAWRKFREMTSTELSEKAGVRIAYLSEVEHDRTIHPQEEFLEKLADALKVPLEDILGRRMPPKDGGMVTTPSSQQTVAKLGSQQLARTAFRSPLTPSDREILLHRLAVAEKRLEAAEKSVQAAEKNLREVHEELRELGALAAEMFSHEVSHGTTPSNGTV